MCDKAWAGGNEMLSLSGPANTIGGQRPRPGCENMMSMGTLKPVPCCSEGLRVLSLPPCDSDPLPAVVPTLNGLGNAQPFCRRHCTGESLATHLIKKTKFSQLSMASSGCTGDLAQAFIQA